MFERMLEAIKQEVVSTISRVQVRAQPLPTEIPEVRTDGFQFQHEEFRGFSAEPPEEQAEPAEAAERPQTFVRGERKIGRNEPCPCGSGKKYKHCTGGWIERRRALDGHRPWLCRSYEALRSGNSRS